MSDRAEPTPQPDSLLPPIVGRALEDPPPPRMAWYRGIAPACLNLFIWAPFFDQLWVGDQSRHSLGWLFASALLGSLLCFGLFLAATSWGFRARRPLVVVASSTFGATGSEWLCGVAVACSGVVWYAIAINFGVDSTLLGLRAGGLMPASAVAAWRAGPFECKSPVFLCTAIFWIYITRTAIMMRLSGVVVALMKVYAPIAVLLLTAAALWRFPLLSRNGLDTTRIAADLASARIHSPGYEAALTMMVGFFAMSGLLSVDWGAAVGSRRDITWAGLSCVLAAAAWTAIMSLIVVIETTSWVGARGHLFRDSRIDPLPFSFRWAVFQGAEAFPAGVAAAILILFGLAAVAPAVSSLAKFSEAISTHWRSLRPSRATWIACPLAFLLMATFQVDRLGPIYRAMGVIFAPVLGAMAGDLLLRSQVGMTIRTGLNPAGLIAWAAGCGVAVALLVTTAIQPDRFAWLPPESICGFIVSACLYRLLDARDRWGRGVGMEHYGLGARDT